MPTGIRLAVQILLVILVRVKCTELTVPIRSMMCHNASFIDVISGVWLVNCPKLLHIAPQNTAKIGEYLGNRRNG